MDKGQGVVAMVGDNDPTVDIRRLRSLLSPLLFDPLVHIFSDHCRRGNFVLLITTAAAAFRCWWCSAWSSWASWAGCGRGDGAGRGKRTCWSRFWRTCRRCPDHDLLLLLQDWLFLRLLPHIAGLLLRGSKGILLVFILAFFNLITVDCVLQFFFFIAMTWIKKVNESIWFCCGRLALYISGRVGANDDRHQKFPFTQSWTSWFCCLRSKYDCQQF